MRRTAENTARYAEAVRQVGKQLNLPVVDVWTAFMKLAGMKQGETLPGSSNVPQNEVLVRLMHDGECVNLKDRTQCTDNGLPRTSPQSGGISNNHEGADESY